jgi:hypothetical protein
MSWECIELVYPVKKRVTLKAEGIWVVLNNPRPFDQFLIFDLRPASEYSADRIHGALRWDPELSTSENAHKRPVMSLGCRVLLYGGTTEQMDAIAHELEHSSGLKIGTFFFVENEAYQQFKQLYPTVCRTKTQYGKDLMDLSFNQRRY